MGMRTLGTCSPFWTQTGLFSKANACHSTLRRREGYLSLGERSLQAGDLSAETRDLCALQRYDLFCCERAERDGRGGMLFMRTRRHARLLLVVGG